MTRCHAKSVPGRKPLNGVRMRIRATARLSSDGDSPAHGGNQGATEYLTPFGWPAAGSNPKLMNPLPISTCVSRLTL